ncbi:forespore capture DNA-binding protein RefZ [Bacillus pinisoli]|uniref:forespore capture DNA-binding protein RefZ n=1 Tax=Bacillus pinisoli TaxID=2901866 RepID=UPI001FF1FD94|nr:forespore capture DNA-binding protein RefZ [Bacillus pinisoli]
MSQPNSKEKVISASIGLFNTKGFNGTSVRDIANKANVNIAIVSYYFKNKKGLLEYLISLYFDQYIHVIEKVLMETDLLTTKEKLKVLTKALLKYQVDHRQLARFVYREMTLDNVLIREVMATYLAKEKYYFKQLFEDGIRSKEFRKLEIPSVIAQFKGMLSMPVLQPQYFTEVLHIIPYDEYFFKQYMKEMENWIELSICHSPTVTFINKPSYVVGD